LLYCSQSRSTPLFAGYTNETPPLITTNRQHRSVSVVLQTQRACKRYLWQHTIIAACGYPRWCRCRPPANLCRHAIAVYRVLSWYCRTLLLFHMSIAMRTFFLWYKSYPCSYSGSQTVDGRTTLLVITSQLQIERIPLRLGIADAKLESNNFVTMAAHRNLDKDVGFRYCVRLPHLGIQAIRVGLPKNPGMSPR